MATSNMFMYRHDMTHKNICSIFITCVTQLENTVYSGKVTTAKFSKINFYNEYVVHLGRPKSPIILQ